MRISRIAIKNLGAHKATDITLPPITVFLGPNGHGKTTLIDTAFVARYGTARGLDVKDAADLRMEGTKRWETDTYVLDKDAVEHQVHRTATTCSHSEKELDALFKNRRVWRALLEVAHFPDMDADARRSLVADLRSTATDGGVLARASSLGLPKPVIDALAEGNYRKAHRGVVEARRAADTVVIEADDSLQSEIPNPTVSTANGDVPVSQIDPAQMEEAHQKALALIAEHEDYGKKVAKAAGQQEALDDARADLAALTDAPWSEQDERDLVEAARERSACRAIISQATALRGAHGARATELEQLYAKKAPCDVCGADTDDELGRKALWDARDRELKRAKERLTVIDAEAKKDKDLEAKVRELEEKKKRHLQAKTYRSRVEGKIDRLSKALGLGPAPFGSLPDLRAKAEKIAEAKAMRMAYDATVKQLGELRESIFSLKGRADALAVLEEEIDPAKAEGLDGARQEINEFLNTHAARVLRATSDPNVIVHLTEDWEITLWGRRFSQASRSEQYRAGFLFACALSQLSGLRFVVIDDMDGLDDAQRGKAISFLAMLYQGAYIDGAIMAAAKDSRATVKAPPVDWCGFFWVENGAVEPIRAMQRDVVGGAG